MDKNNLIPRHMLSVFFILAMSVFTAWQGPVLPVAVAQAPLAPAALSGTVYYVAVDGNDSNPGTQAQPWKTIQRAAGTMVAGDTVIVASGTYNELVTETTSGTAGNMIRYLASGLVNCKGFHLGGDYIEVKGFTVTSADCSWNGNIDVWGSYCVVEGNTIQDSTRIGITTRLDSTGCIIRGNTITRGWSIGMSISGSNHLIENNDISDIRDHVGDCDGGSGDAIHFHGTGHVFRGNYIHELIPANQLGALHMDAFQTFSDPANGKPAAKNCIIERNHIFWGDSNTGLLAAPWKSGVHIYGFMVQGTTSDRCENLIIRNNLVESFAGLNAGGGGGGAGAVNGLKIYNNTFRSDHTLPITYSAAVGISMDQELVTDVEIYNHISVDFTSRHFHLLLATASYDYNLMWDSDGGNPSYGGYTLQAHDQYKVDPLFVANMTDFHLQPDSPCIDAGRSLTAVTDDLDGDPRPQGTAYDIGADEYAGAGPTLLGDVNGDSLVDSTDALIVLSADAGYDTSQFCPMNCGDANADGLADSTDALIILSYDAGMTVPFPVGQPGCPSSVGQPPGCTP